VATPGQLASRAVVVALASPALRREHAPVDPEAAREARRQLLHDVGKYVARIAKNLPPDGPIAAPLAAMLVKDLYETHRGRPASARFAELEEALAQDSREVARAHLSAIDALQGRVRQADAAAMREAAGHAIAVEKVLRDAAR
jgi:hypothetical protein